MAEVEVSKVKRRRKEGQVCASEKARLFVGPGLCTEERIGLGGIEGGRPHYATLETGALGWKEQERKGGGWEGATV